MPLAFVIALAASLGIHAILLLGTEFELFGRSDETIPLMIELQPPPQNNQKVGEFPRAVKPERRVNRQHAKRVESVIHSTKIQGSGAEYVLPTTISPKLGELESIVETENDAVPESAVTAILPAKGAIRFNILFGENGFAVGRAEHAWIFSSDGRYRLTGRTETSGLIALFKPLVYENESNGLLTATGLLPESFRSRKNGKETQEKADFDWPNTEVRLTHTGRVESVAPGTQDILSLNYQLAYLKGLEGGVTVGVVTGKKYDLFSLDSLGEEWLDIPAGRFRCLHLRVVGDTVTEIWIALDRYRLPVKIRYTDKKGDIYEQVATEIGSP